MIRRFREVNSNLFRGSAPSIEDVIFLSKKLGIKKIVSLDKQTGDHIDRATKLLGIKHIICPIDINNKATLISFLRKDLYKLLIDGGPTFVHCAQGKDRTGLAIALYRCLYDKWDCKKALKEAYKLGFGIKVNPKIIKLYVNIIKKACNCNENLDDINHAWEGEGYDIVSNQREYPSDYKDYSLDTWEQQSWSPYEDYRVREYPLAGVNVDWPEQYDTRETYGLDDRNNDHQESSIPMVGQWDSSVQGINGAGPSLVGSGFV